jgi:O-antigen/teichoic acid export membrane protein
MNSTKRAVVNTIAQHVRSLFNICLSLYSTRLILQALGHSDYGIYSLVAGQVAMLGFVTNAMVTTTQRHISFYHGKDDMENIKKIFSNSLFLHIVICILLFIILYAITPLLFNGFLNIAPENIDIAKVVYYLTIITLCLTFLYAPFRALFIAHENIIYISIIDVLDGIFKLLLAIWLMFIDKDRLIIYACMMAGIMLFNLFSFSIYAKFKYEETVLFPSIKLINRKHIKQLMGFAGWTIYSTGCILARTQGVALLLNRFFGVIINSSYGIATQIYGSVQFVAQAIMNAMSPQVVKAEGAGNRKKMLALAAQTSKYAYLMLAMVVIPIVFEMPQILNIWLGKVPPNATTLCSFVLLTAVCDQLTIGLGTANQAIGKIRNYSITINTIKVMTLPAAWICLKSGFPVVSVMICYIVFEFICAMMRLPFLKKTAGLSIRMFVNKVFLRIAIPTLSSIATAAFMVNLFDFKFRFIVTFIVCVFINIMFIWLTALSKGEKQEAMRILNITPHQQ